MVTQGNLTLLTQGTVICPLNTETDISVLDSKVRLRFINDTAKTTPRTEFELLEGILVLKFYGFDSAYGIATPEPLDIGKIGAKTILLSAAIYSIGEPGKEVRVVHYNFFGMSEEQNV